MMKLSEKAVEVFANSLLECDGEAVEAYGVKGLKSNSWRKKFKNRKAFEAWISSEAGGNVEIHGVRVIPDEENPANKEDS